MKTVRYLGIDFGSSTTSIVGFLKDDKGPVLFGRAESDYQFKSVVLKDGDKHYFFQDVYTELARRLTTAKAEGKSIDSVDLGEICDDLKERLVNEKSSAAEYNAYVFLKKVAEVVQGLQTFENGEYDFSQLEGVVFGHPAYYEANAIDYYCKTMESIVKRVLKETFRVDTQTNGVKIIGVAEPVLAACAYGYAYGDKFKEGETILVLDFGGHTLDVALMKAVKTEEGIRLIKEKNCVSFNEAVEMGKQITRELCEEVYCGRAMRGKTIPFDWGVDDAKCELFSGSKDFVEKSTQFRDLDDNNNETAKRYRLKYYVGDADEEGVISFVGQGKGKICIEEKFARIVEFIRVYLASVSEELDENKKKISVNYVLFTGGTAKMAPLRRHICGQLYDWLSNQPNSCELLMDNEDDKEDDKGNIFQSPKLSLDRIMLSSKNAVALGAALVAAGKCNPILTVKEKSNEELKAAIKKNERLEQKQKEMEMQLDIERLKLGVLSETRRKLLLTKLEEEQSALFKRALAQAIKNQGDEDAFLGWPEEEKKTLYELLDKLRITE